jgi:hypothetical protein
VNYREQFAELTADEKPDELITSYWTPEKGDSICGILTLVENAENDKFEEDVNRYVLDTDDGPQSVLLGSAADKQLEGKIEVGKLTYIEYLGKVEIQGGAKQLNRWKVQQIGDPLPEFSRA